MPSGIIMTDGFFVAAKKPADMKSIADTIEARDAYVTDNVAYEGMLVYVSEDGKTYQYTKDNTWKEFGFNQEAFESQIYDGLDSDSTTFALSARQGKVLNTNLTTHINDNIKHITAQERTTWNAKANSTVATQTANGLMSAADKAKLDGIEEGANNYVHPPTHPATMITEDATHRFVSDSEKTTWNAKADKTIATISANGLMSAADKTKLDGIEAEANKYTHPNDSNTRHVTDAQITAWNAKADNTVATQTSNGLMSSTDKINLDNLMTKMAVMEKQQSEMLAKLKTAVFVDDE